ncbi:unannotated protein [freshwater metagenome]|uniref:Unannotated protein n=1 Tax=freshwater metagenome TaxID=449393 RepID=A0A6J6F0Z9_9ZZZZ
MWVRPNRFAPTVVVIVSWVIESGQLRSTLTRSGYFGSVERRPRPRIGRSTSPLPTAFPRRVFTRRAAISRWTTNGFAVFTIPSTRSRMRRNSCQKSCFTPSSLTINRKRVNVEPPSHWRCSPTRGAPCPITAFSGPRVARSPQPDSKTQDSTFVKEVGRERSVSKLRAVTISKRWN